MSRLRANKITNQLADGSPTVEKGLIIAGVTTVTTLDLNGDLDVDGHLNVDNVNITGVTTSTQLVNINRDASQSTSTPLLLQNSAAAGTLASPDVVKLAFGSQNAVKASIRAEVYGNGNLAFHTNNDTEKVRITADGKLLVGSTNHNTVIGSGVGSQLQIEGNTYQTSSLALINNQSSTDPAFLVFGKSRAGSSGGTTVVQNGDRLGGIRFCGADGSDLHSIAATIDSYVDGAPGSNDIPGRLVFATTPDGSSTPTDHEILYGSTKEIRNSGYYVAQTSGSGTSSQVASFGATQSGMDASSYNYVLSGSNNVGNRCVLFVNGSTRSADGGTNGMTLRNDGGPLTLGNNSTRTTLRGDYVLYPERPAFHVTNFTWSNSTKFAHGGTATYNRGSHWNVSTGTFTAPVAGDYVMFISVQVHAPNEISGRHGTYSNVYAQKNGSNIGGEIVGTVQVGGYAFHGTLSHSLVVYLAANDTFRWNSGYGFRYGQNTLYGYLLG